MCTATVVLSTASFVCNVYSTYVGVHMVMCVHICIYFV
jgi:hypothetical protein